MMRSAGLELNVQSYEIIIQGLCTNQELEHALDLLGDMTVSVDENGQPDENGRPTIAVRPSLSCFTPVIQLAQSLHESETAYLVLKMAEVQAGLSRIPAVVYTDLMARAAEDYVVRQHGLMQERVSNNVNHDTSFYFRFTTAETNHYDDCTCLVERRRILLEKGSQRTWSMPR